MATLTNTPTSTPVPLGDLAEHAHRHAHAAPTDVPGGKTQTDDVVALESAQVPGDGVGASLTLAPSP